MTDPWVPRPKVRRRKRKATGVDVFAALAPEQGILDLGKDRGLKCKSCGKWRPWAKVQASYEWRSKELHRLWRCDQCGDVLRDDLL